MKFDVIVIGGGAAGLLCAIEAGKRGRRTLVIEHNAKVGRKIIISGGGRCNFTNLHTSPENFISQNPHFAKSALSRFTPQDFIGDVIGDLSRRRGHVEGQEPRGNAVAVRASVPLAAMFGYATDLRSSTQGRATYTMQFDRYEEVPGSIAEEIVETRTGEPVGASA